MSEAQETLELSEAQIAVHWKEEEYIYPPAPFIAQANMTDPQIYERFSLEHFPECFKEYADLLTWYQYWHTTLDTSDAPCWKWFVGGKINAAYNCVDRHLPQYKNKAAIHLRPGAGERTARGHHVSGTVCTGERDGGAAARFCRHQGGRSCHHPHAHGAGTARSPCWPAPDWGRFTRWCLAALVASRAASALPTPAAGC